LLRLSILVPQRKMVPNKRERKEKMVDTRTGGAEEATTAHEATARQAGGDERTTRRSLARIGSVAALLGAAVFFVSGLFHPSESDPNNLPAAFAEYVTSSDWVGVHLAQLAGVALIAVALVALEATFEPGRAAAWARIGSVGAVASAALYAANQGVDGVSNHVVDHRWAAATGAAHVRAFEAAFAVRQIEVALTSVFTLSLGFTLCVFGLAMLFSRRYPAWLGVTGILGGLATVAIGLEQAFHGFSSLALNLFMVVGLVDLMWVCVTGVLMWRLAPRLAGDGDAARQRLEKESE
jgi:hypothetical protein